MIVEGTRPDDAELMLLEIRRGVRAVRGEAGSGRRELRAALAQGRGMVVLWDTTLPGSRSRGSRWRVTT